jgi:hypothetical protein
MWERETMVYIEARWMAATEEGYNKGVTLMLV